MTVPDLEARVTRILTSRLGLPADAITPEARLIEDLGLDSLDAMELAIAAEREFEVALSEEQVAQLTTVADLLALIPRLADETGGQGPEAVA